jgi:hypothetical protein
MCWGALLVSVTKSAQVEQRYGQVSAPDLSPLSHSVANTVKRVVIILASVAGAHTPALFS